VPHARAAVGSGSRTLHVDVDVDVDVDLYFDVNVCVDVVGRIVDDPAEPAGRSSTWLVHVQAKVHVKVHVNVNVNERGIWFGLSRWRGDVVPHEVLGVRFSHPS